MISSFPGETVGEEMSVVRRRARLAVHSASAGESDEGGKGVEEI